MGVDIHWLVKLTPGHRFNEGELVKGLETAMLSHPIPEIFSTADGKLKFISILSYCRWAPVTAEANAIARHTRVFKELAAMQEVLGAIPLYYGDDYGDWPTYQDTEEEALATLERYKLVDDNFTLMAQLLSLEAQEKDRADGR